MPSSFPCFDCISLPICKSLIEIPKDCFSYNDLNLLRNRCSLIKDYLNDMSYSIGERMDRINILSSFFTNKG